MACCKENSSSRGAPQGLALDQTRRHGSERVPAGTESIVRCLPLVPVCIAGLQEKERQRAKKAKSEQKHKLSFDDDFGEDDDEDEEAGPGRPPQQEGAQVGEACRRGVRANLCLGA